MPRQIRAISTTGPQADSKVLKFVSRAEQLRLRGQRNYGRWKLLTKGFVKADGPERAAWHQESAQESLRDAEWNRRHGPVPGGRAFFHGDTSVEERGRSAVRLLTHSVWPSGRALTAMATDPRPDGLSTRLPRTCSPGLAGAAGAEQREIE